jgi:hypothetical protein
MGENRVDPTLYEQMVGKFIYLPNTRPPNISFETRIINCYMFE